MAVVAFLSLAGWAHAAGLDSSFGTDGRDVVGFGEGSAVAGDVAVQPDGRILAVGWINSQFGLVRLLPNGALDPSFGSGGVSLLGFGGQTQDRLAPALALQPDGRIVVAGSANGSGGTDFALARVDTRGALDPTFGNGGKVTTAVAPGFSKDIAEDVAVLGDGRIVAAGYADGASGGSDFAAVRYLASGALDPSFATGGIAVVPMSPDSNADSASGLAAFPDGRLALAGATLQPMTAFDFAALRLTSAGVADPAFGGDGWATIAVGDGAWQEVITDTALMPDGRQLIGGLAFQPGFGPSQVAVARLLSDGTPDPAFGNAGRVLDALGANEDTSAGVLQSGTTTYLAVGSRGTETTPAGETIYTRRLGVLALDEVGRPDTTFADSGALLFHVTALGDDRVGGIAQRADGALVLVGTVRTWTADRDSLGFAVVIPHTSGVVPPPRPPDETATPVAATPTSRITMPWTAYRARRVAMFRGTAKGSSGVKRVDIAVVKRAGKSCAYLRSSKPSFRTQRAPSRGRCRNLVWLKASGTKSWQYRLKKSLPAGLYAVYSRASGGGLVEKPAAPVPFRVLTARR